MGTSFALEKTDQKCLKKRKAMGDGFRKEWLVKMLDVLKCLLREKIEKWNHEIDAHPDKEIVIDITTELKDILGKHMSIMCCGEDIFNMEIECDVRKSRGGAEFSK
jgi:hypothetical protein